MTRDEIAAEAENFFEWYGKRTNTVTFTSCLLFAEHIAKMEREACAKLCDQFDSQNPYIGQGRECAKIIRARGMK